MAKRIKRLRAQLAAAVAERDEARRALIASRTGRAAAAPPAAALPERAARMHATLDLGLLRRDLEVRRVELHNASARYGALVNQRGRSAARTIAAGVAGGAIDESARTFVRGEDALHQAERELAADLHSIRPVTGGTTP